MSGASQVKTSVRIAFELEKYFIEWNLKAIHWPPWQVVGLFYKISTWHSQYIFQLSNGYLHHRAVILTYNRMNNRHVGGWVLSELTNERTKLGQWLSHCIHCNQNQNLYIFAIVRFNFSFKLKIMNTRACACMQASERFPFCQ